jgi:hypothetical protein
VLIKGTIWLADMMSSVRTKYPKGQNTPDLSIEPLNAWILEGHCDEGVLVQHWLSAC